MKSPWIAIALLGLVLPVPAQEATSFVRPDCSAYRDSAKPEETCIRKERRKWQDANFAALQSTGLTFNQMGRPDPDENPEAKKLLDDKVEGSFVIRYSVSADGKVSDVKIVEVAGGVMPLARLWADTIARWTFLKGDKPFKDIEYRRIYLYPAKDDADAERNARAGI